MNEAVSEEVSLQPTYIQLGKGDRGRGIIERGNSNVSLFRFVLGTIYGHFHEGYEYTRNNTNTTHSLPPYSEWEESQYRAVKTFMIDKYNNRGRTGEDPDNEILIKNHVEATSSIDIAFDNHIILPHRVLSNENQPGLNHREKYYFALYPLARGGDIFEALQEHFDTEESCRVIFRQIFKGVQYLHNLNIYHNDLKPENIVTNAERNVAHIIDFGQAIIVNNGNERIPKTGTGYGTNLYCPPELSIRNTDTTFDWRKADVWALGTSLYIMLIKNYPLWTDNGRILPVGPDNEVFLSLFGENGNFREYCMNENLGLSDNVIDLLQRMLHANVNRRISIDEILLHPWLRDW